MPRSLCRRRSSRCGNGGTRSTGSTTPPATSSAWRSTGPGCGRAPHAGPRGGWWRSTRRTTRSTRWTCGKTSCRCSVRCRRGSAPPSSCSTCTATARRTRPRSCGSAPPPCERSPLRAEPCSGTLEARMAEVRELFEMTTKQMEPDQDSWRRQEERQQRTARKKKFGALAVAATIAIIAAGIAWSLNDQDGADGSTPADTGVDTGPATGDWPETFLVDLGTGETTPIDELGLDQDLDVSPDGASIASGGRQIMVADITGGNVRKFEATKRANREGVNAPRWSPDGRTIVYQVNGAAEKIGNLFALDVASGKVTQL